MVNFIAYIFGGAITFPLLITLLVYCVAKTFYKNKWKAIHLTVNYTTFLYILSVIAILSVIFEQNYTGVVLIVLLVLLSGFLILQWKKKGEIIFLDVWKVYWRFTFLLFVFAQFVLVLIGLSIKIISV